MTHAIVTVPTHQDADASGIRASVAFCFGPGDENAITCIHYRCCESGAFWEVPHVEVVVDGHKTMTPVFRGELLMKLCQAAARALERVKETIGTPQWGTTYRVFGSPDGSPMVEVIP
jgi:hypothetical protein